MILITGANGHFGKATIEALLKKGTDKSQITGLVRDETKGAELKALGINIRIGDYNNYDSLQETFKGIDKLLFVSGTELANRTAQQTAAVHAAKAAGVNHILYTSVDRHHDKEDSAISFILGSHLATEKAIKESGLAYTILRNNVYLEYLPGFLGEKVLETGIFLPAGEGRVGFALRTEMAEATANIIASKGHEHKEYNISGTQPASFGEIAQMLTNITGKTIAYHSPDAKTYVETLTKAGVPTEYAEMFGGFATAAQQGELSAGNTDLETLLGRTPTSVEAFLKQYYGH